MLGDPSCLFHPGEKGTALPLSGGMIVENPTLGLSNGCEQENRSYEGPSVAFFGLDSVTTDLRLWPPLRGPVRLPAKEKPAPSRLLD